jgi:hypothetical protein
MTMESPFFAGGNIQWHSLCGKVWQFLKRLNVELPYDSALPLPGIYLTELQTYVQIKSIHKFSQQHYL